MGLFDNLGGALKGMLGQVEAGAVPSLINAALAKTNFGDLQGLVNQLQQGGLGPQVQSWLGNGANMSITPDPLRAALGSDQVRQPAGHFGGPGAPGPDPLSRALAAGVSQASANRPRGLTSV